MPCVSTLLGSNQGPDEYKSSALPTELRVVGSMINSGTIYTSPNIMMPLEIIFNILAALILLVYWGVTFIIIYHLTRFGIGVQPKRFAAIFLLGSVVLSATATIFFLKIDINSLLPQ